MPINKTKAAAVNIQAVSPVLIAPILIKSSGDGVFGILEKKRLNIARAVRTINGA